MCLRYKLAEDHRTLSGDSRNAGISFSGVAADRGAGIGLVMYLRFVVADAARKLWDEEKLHAHEEEHYSSNCSLVRRPFGVADALYRFQASVLSQKSKAISWFKDTAHKHLSKIRELVVILEHHGISVRILKPDLRRAPYGRGADGHGGAGALAIGMWSSVAGGGTVRMVNCSGLFTCISVRGTEQFLGAGNSAALLGKGRGRSSGLGPLIRRFIALCIAGGRGAVDDSF